MVKNVSPPPENSSELEDDGPFPWKAWALLRIVTVVVIVGGFVAALTVAMHSASSQAEAISQQRDAQLRISPNDLQKVSDRISNAYATLPSDIPLIYTDAKTNCTDTTKSGSRIICFKDKAYAKLRLNPSAGNGLTAADTLNGAFTTANWNQTTYSVTKKDGAVINRNDSDGSDVLSIKMAYKSPLVDNKYYCIGIVYWQANELQWKGSVQECK